MEHKRLERKKKEEGFNFLHGTNRPEAMAIFCEDRKRQYGNQPDLGILVCSGNRDDEVQ